MRARIMRGRARVRVEGLKRGKDGRGGVVDYHGGRG